MIEIVLASGKFAQQTREIELGDLVAAYHDNTMLMTLILAHRLFTVDGRKLPPEDWAKMPAVEFMPVLAAIGEQVKEFMKHTKGIA